MAACRPWLASELTILQPRVLVALGGTAAQTLLGSSVRVLRDRGEIIASDFCPQTIVTVYLSSLLRAPTKPPAPPPARSSCKTCASSRS